MAISEENRREFEAIKEAVDRFLESDEEERLVPMKDGSTMRLSRDPDAPGGVRVSDAEADHFMGTQTFEADERPEDFPEDVPFLGGVSTVVTRLGEPSRLFAVVWVMVPDARSRFAEVLRWHGDAGWTEVEEDIQQTLEQGSEILRSSQRIRLEKDGVKRGLSMMQLKEDAGVINLFEKSIDTD